MEDGRDATPAGATQVHRTQRLGAYAVVLRTRDDGEPVLLLTRVSPVGYPAGWWALPGGGVDHGESPNDAVLRELHEETGLVARSSRLVEVHDVHTVAPGRGDRFEDYHGVHLVYAVTVDDGPDGGLPHPHVLDVGGTTDVAVWVPLADLGPGDGRRLLPVVEHVLARLDAYR